MNKFGIVLGVAAVATLAGCKDPDYKRKQMADAYNDVKNVPTETDVSLQPGIIAAPEPHCTCKPGTVHAEPCACGASDCACVVRPAPAITVTPVATSVKPVSVPAPAVSAAEHTTYIVQNGDLLSKISKRYNITIAAILAANPGLNPDKIRVGQKINLPGQVDVGEQKAPAVAATKAVAVKAAYRPYAGATKAYVVKSGDTLGALAIASGLSLRQFKELNGLSSDNIRVGQKLIVPAEKAEKSATVAKPAAAKAVAAKAAQKKSAEVDAAAKQVAAAAEAAAAKVAAAGEEVAQAVTDAAVDAAAAVSPAKDAPTYQVQEGDDITGVSIRWGVSAAAIREANNFSEDAQLTPGQVIRLPEGVDVQQ